MSESLLSSVRLSGPTWSDGWTLEEREGVLVHSVPDLHPHQHLLSIPPPLTLSSSSASASASASASHFSSSFAASASASHSSSSSDPHRLSLSQNALIPPLWDLFTQAAPFRWKRDFIKFQDVEQLESPICGLKWNWHNSCLAIAHKNHSIYIFDKKKDEFVATLSHYMQKDIYCIEWKPFSCKMMAVGCRDGICIWMESLKPRQSDEFPMTDMNFFHFPGHKPVNALSWSPNGQLLASGSTNDNGIIILDVALETSIPLKGGLGGIIQLSWSPNGAFLCSTSTSGELKIWDTRTWTAQIWKLETPCKSLAWSPNGKALIFATLSSPLLHCLETSRGSSNFGSRTFQEDLSQTVKTRGGEEILVGGNISEICLDPTGERLVVSFTGSQEGSELLALFSVKFSPTFELTGRGLICGQQPTQNNFFKASQLAFAQKFDQGALLAMAWTNGTVSFLPLYFVPEKKIFAGAPLRSW